MSYIERYTKQFKCRFTNGEKRKAREALMKDFEELGVKGEEITKRKFLSKSTSLVFGNTKVAKSAIVVPLDTPAKVTWPVSKYFPQDGNANLGAMMLPMFAPVLILYGVVLLLSMKVLDLVSTNEMLKIFTWVMTILLGALIIFMLVRGFKNRNNTNRNSIAIAAVLDLASRMSEAERKQYMYVFADKTCSKAAGAKAVAEEMVNRGRNLDYIILDCIGTGDELRLGFNSSSKKLARDILKANKIKDNIDFEMHAENRTQLISGEFERACVISRGTTDKKGRLCVYGSATGKDKVYEEEKVEEVIQMIHTYLTRK